MSNKGMKLRTTDKKGEKGEGGKSEGTKKCALKTCKEYFLDEICA